MPIFSPGRIVKLTSLRTGRCALVAEADVLEADLPLGLRQRLRLAGLAGLGRRVQQLEDALAAGHEAGEPGRELRERGERGVEHGKIGKKRHQRTERHLARQHVAPAHVPDDQAAQAEDQGHDGRERGGGLLHGHPRAPEVVARAVKPIELARLLGKRLDDADAREHARQRAGLLAAGIPVAVILGIDSPPEEQASPHDERGGDQGEERELGVEREEHEADGDHLNDLEQETAGDLLQERVQDLAVVGDAAHERADLVAIVVAHAQRMELLDELRPELEGEGDADLVRLQSLDPVHQAQQHARVPASASTTSRSAATSDVALGRGFALGQDLVDQILLQLRRRQLHGHADEHQPAHRQGRGPLRPHELPEPADDRLSRQAARA